jgi:hypothetical protein
MLILLPAAAYIVLFLALLGYEDTSHPEHLSRRAVLLQTALVLGAYMVLFSELLSLLHKLSTPWVALFWGAGLAAAAFTGWKMGWLASGAAALRRDWRRLEGFDLAAGTMLVIILALLLLVAIKSPANNNDSLRYHMSRVMHWVQNESLAHYPTPLVAQVLHPINAELMILHTRLLWGNDGLANAVQWLSLLGALVAVSAITSLFGGGRMAQWASVAFVVSLPSGLLEATSTQNDFVTAFYLASLLFFIFRLAVNGIHPRDLLWVGLALGLGLLTKGTFYAYAFVPMLFLVVLLFRKENFKKALLHLLVIGVIAGALNLGVWSRNIISFGSPLGQGDFVSAHTAGNLKPGTVVGRIAQIAAQNLATPSDNFNARLVAGMKALISPINPGIRRFSLEWGWNHEDLAGNPIHVLLILVSLVLLIAFRGRLKSRSALAYAAIVLSSYVMFAMAVPPFPYGIRLQLPFFVAMAPVFGTATDSLERRGFVKVVTMLLLVAALPWVLFNRTRPLIAMRPSSDPFTIPCLAGCTTGSILVEPPETTMFAVWGDKKNDYVEAMQLVSSTSCQDIGLVLDSSDLEYAYWWLLDAPQSGRRLESLVAAPELERYLDPSFEPCVIICTECGQDQLTLNGLDLAEEFHGIKIYVRPEYLPER